MSGTEVSGTEATPAGESIGQLLARRRAERGLDIAKAAQDGFIEDEPQTEPKAKAAFTVEWDALAMAPKVGVKIAWSVRFKDESETEIDPLQSKLGLEVQP